MSVYKNSFHWRNNSGELDVFEAAQYFSGANENPGFIDRPQGQRAARMSLDLPIMMNPILNPDNLPTDQKQPKENKKYKQPRSPGGRLASFLNSLFNQTTSRKKKPKSGLIKDLDQEERPGGGRKRRSSISHFRITTTSAANDSNSSGFTFANTPTKSYKELRNFPADHQKVNFSVPENLGNAEKTSTDCGRTMDEKFRFSNGNISRNGLSSNIRISSARNWADNEEIRDFRKFSDADDGADSDSSSDLFDLPNHDLDFYSSGLPVYGTTHIDRIRIGPPVS
ncbi:protein BIG GRAIN 1-like E [Sesamum alatum]|uniref:Protein BIG GRAIN 1-like E n=1 Tax=Sesamum alatum TaxID=300844 RepID=A0AAE1YH52_9LAMI|nr:protein BIG GRAIN 1-like E [Sesamum alatum]